MKKSVLCKIAMLATCCILALSPLAGCGADAIPDTEDTLEIYIQDLGYGTQWLNDEIALFKEQDWVKEKYPNLNIPTPASNAQYGYGQAQIEAGPKVNAADLLFFAADYGLHGKTDSHGEMYIDDLNSVFESKVPGEDILYKDKMFDEHESTSKYGDKYWSTLWSCMYQGFMYNAGTFAKLGLEVPNTTDELIELCKKVKTEKYTSELDTSTQLDYTIMYSTKRTEAMYWQYMAFPIWWAQYEGMDNFKNFYKAIDSVSGTRDSKDVFRQKGRLKSMEVIKTLLHDYGYVNASSIDFIEAQNRFLVGDGLIMANGDWLYEEMRTAIEGFKKRGIECDIRFMKNPVISSIIDVLPNKSVANDDERSDLIKAIDAGSSSLKGEGYEVTQADYDRVKAARNYVSTEFLNQAFVPKYATAKGLAKDFLSFLATDKALNQFMRSTRGATLPFKYDVKTADPELYASFDGVQKYRDEIFMADPEFLPSTRNEAYPFMYLGGMKFVPVDMMDSDFTGNVTAQQFFDKQVAYYSGSQWDTVLRNMGKK